jgi:hypothetical protein
MITCQMVEVNAEIKMEDAMCTQSAATIVDALRAQPDLPELAIRFVLKV